MKTRVTAIIIAALTIALAGCSNQSKEEETTVDYGTMEVYTVSESESEEKRTDNARQNSSINATEENPYTNGDEHDHTDIYTEDDAMYNFSMFQYNVMMDANSYNSTLAMISADLEGLDTNVNTTGLNTLYESAETISLVQAIPGDLIFYTNHGAPVDVAVLGGRNRVFYIKDGRCTEGVIDDLGREWTFKRVFSTENVSEEMLDISAEEGGVVSPELSVDNGVDISIFDESQLEDLRFAVSNLVSTVSTTGRPEHIIVTDIDTEFFENYCDITIVVDGGIGMTHMMYNYDTKTFKPAP